MEGLKHIWDTFFDLDLIGSTLPTLLKEGLLNTLFLTVLASAIGLVVGIFLASGLMSKFRVLRLPCRWYVDILRGLPHILSIYLIGQGLPLAGLTVFGDWTYGYAALAIGLMEGAYMAEIFRSGFQSVDKGIVEASRSLGLSHTKTMRLIVIPIGFRRVLPALTGQFILVIKSTALVYLLGLAAGQREMFAIAQDTSTNNASLSPLVAAGLFYLAITVPLTYVVNKWDKRMREGRPAASTAPKAVRTEEALA
ncbi:amino acid ABC transporter permease [Amycolatopsis sp. FDAARGOS 1241]|uniref:amino acid ABC transporter permease n=1 Tax=Amycolatopsis sp. FDAARGOS 1241 TaxID=2778070 RepID=UPI0019516EFD|nr:amino acid ABC transporter permease [Amycolatopsis sp. FDAARGOS 1241]QRP47677.1 amino acid ABC transporter permease [Amycolatopsis sp. FDAARGOS 1241]